MRIEYELNFRDYWLFTCLHYLLSIPIQLFYIGFSGFIFYSRLNENAVLKSLLIAFSYYLIFWLVVILFTAFFLLFGKRRSTLGSRIVEIQDDAFYEETQFNKSCHFWPGILKVISLPGFIAVYIDPNLAYIIPNRAFENPRQKQEFLTKLREKIPAI